MDEEQTQPAVAIIMADNTTDAAVNTDAKAKDAAPVPPEDSVQKEDGAPAVAPAEKEAEGEEGQKEAASTNEANKNNDEKKKEAALATMNNDTTSSTAADAIVKEIDDKEKEGAKEEDYAEWEEEPPQDDADLLNSLKPGEKSGSKAKAGSTEVDDNANQQVENANDETEAAVIRKKDACMCSWPNCAQLNAQLFDNDSRKGLVAISNVTGTLQKSICFHLGIEQITASNSTNNNRSKSPQRFVIAKHHWIKTLVDTNTITKRRWTTYLSLSEACRQLHTVDKKDSFKHSATHEIMYVQAPNVPIHVVEQSCWTDADSDERKEAAAQLANRNEVIDKLIKENSRLKTAVSKHKENNSTLQKQIKKFEKIKTLANSPHWISTNTLLEFLNNHYGGLTRYTIQSDEWHSNNPNAAKELLGYPTWQAAKDSICKQFPQLVEKGPVQTPPRIFQSKKGVLQLDDVSEFEKCLCVKVMDRTGLTKSRAALLFGRQDRTVTYWRQAWCPQWGISRDGLEQSKHKAHLNQATRKTPRNKSTAAAAASKKAAAGETAAASRKRKAAALLALEAPAAAAAAVVHRNEPRQQAQAATTTPQLPPLLLQHHQHNHHPGALGHAQTAQAHAGAQQQQHHNTAGHGTQHPHHVTANANVNGGADHQHHAQQHQQQSLQDQQQQQQQHHQQLQQQLQQQQQQQLQAQQQLQNQQQQQLPQLQQNPEPTNGNNTAAAAAVQFPHFPGYQQFLQQHQHQQQQQQQTAQQQQQQQQVTHQQQQQAYTFLPDAEGLAAAAAAANLPTTAAAQQQNKQRRAMYNPYAQL